jgi:amino acid transporter
MALVRAIGRVGLTALVVNCIIGTSIFGMPGEVYRQLGRASPLAMVAGALCMAVFIACAAEVGSQFSAAGGAYLYVRRTFGRFAGLLVAWFWFLAGAGGMAAASNLFAVYQGSFVPALTIGWVRALTLGLLIAIPTIVNCRGVRGGSALSAFMALMKITPLGLLALLGLAHFGASQALPRAADVMVPGWSAWGTVLLLLLSAFGGWEDALAPTGEVKQPRHTLPFALAAGLLISAALYAVVQYVVTAGGVSTEHALADIAVILVGPAGGTLVAVAAMLSTYRYMSADVVATPRLLYSLAVEGDLPELLARVHPRFSHADVPDRRIRRCRISLGPERYIPVGPRAGRGCCSSHFHGDLCIAHPTASAQSDRRRAADSLRSGGGSCGNRCVHPAARATRCRTIRPNAHHRCDRGRQLAVGRKTQKGRGGWLRREERLESGHAEPPAMNVRSRGSV